MLYHYFHMVEKSPWPMLSSFSSLILTLSLINLMHNKNFLFLLLALLIIFMNMFQWWRDISREATFQGHHTIIIKSMLKWSMILFIISEILFFFSFFWAYFHMSLSPDINLGFFWPPQNTTIFNPYLTPLLNTMILLSSGMTVTMTHHNILNKTYNYAIMSLLITICLGFYFSFLQLEEYLEASFTISDSTFGTTFFMTTGFHGMHVIIGSIFLSINLIRMNKGQLSHTHHFSFEAAAWYWHFVDIIWLFLYIFMYWWIF